MYFLFLPLLFCNVKTLVVLTDGRKGGNCGKDTGNFISLDLHRFLLINKLIA